GRSAHRDAEQPPARAPGGHHVLGHLAHHRAQGGRRAAMSFRLYLDLGLYLYLPPHREVRVSTSPSGHPLSEMCAPWVCLADGALLRGQDCLTGELATRPRGRNVASGAHTPPATP